MKLIDTELVGSILLPARTDSEWDRCDALLVKLSKKDCQELLRKMSVVEWLQLSETNQNKSKPAYVVFYEDYGSFVTLDELDLEEDQAVVITEEIAERMEISEPETHFDTGYIRVTEKEVVFLAYGKYTSDKFWTSGLTKEFLTNYLTTYGDLQA